MFFSLERLKASLQIIRQRGLIIERTGVQPDAIRAVRPGLLNRASQQVLAQSASDELRQQSKVRDLDRTIFATTQLEVARVRAIFSHQPQRDLRLVYVRNDFFFGPGQTIDPVIVSAHLEV